MTRRITCGLAVILFLPAVACAQHEDMLVLDTSGFWRCFYTLRQPLVRKGERLEKVGFSAKWLERETGLPPADWAAPGFDDGSWPRVPGVFTRRARRGVGRFSPMAALACKRGKFQVTDPSRVTNLRLSITYHGGVIVYLNGTEIVRGHLPKGREVGPDTLAEDYPLECHVKADGSPLVLEKWSPDKETLRRVALRNRRLEDIVVPARLLRKGVNVLAIEVHRAAYHEKAVGVEQKHWRLTKIGWGTCGLVSARLTASNTEGLVPNVARPKGFQVWNSDPLTSDFDLDYGDPNETLRPISLAGTLGGAFSGKVVVGSGEPIKGIRAFASALLHEKGIAVIPASHVQVRYGLPWGTEYYAAGRYPLPVARFDALASRPPAEVPVRVKKPGRRRRRPVPTRPKPVFGAVVPVWVTVRVPGWARPGKYEGSVIITASGVPPVTVPVRLKVGGWKLPPPTEWRTFVEFIQSPDTLALEYDVPLWSPRHFKLIEESLKILGTVGNTSAYIPLICETNLGNAGSMARWVKKPDGTWGFDFTVMDRYLDLVQRHQGKPKVLCFVVWDTFLEGGRYTGRPKYVPKDVSKDREAHQGLGPEVTVVDAATRKVEKFALPKYSEARSRALWEPLLQELRRRMVRRGLEDAMMLGFVSDTTPTKEVVALFKELLPGVPWLSQGHGGRRAIHGVRVAYTAYVWGGQFPLDPVVERRYGWKRPGLALFFPRARIDGFPMVTHRLMGEVNIAGQQRGFGRQGADLWHVLKNPKGRRVGRVSEGRFPKSSWRNLNIVSAYLAPGPDGPVATARLEMVREGVQECEARIFIERALTDKTLRAKLGEKLAERCQKVLDERTVDLLRGMNPFIFGRHFTSNGGNRHIWWHASPTLGSQWTIHSDWQERSDKLYALATEVAKALAEK